MAVNGSGAGFTSFITALKISSAAGSAVMPQPIQKVFLSTGLVGS